MEAASGEQASRLSALALHAPREMWCSRLGMLAGFSLLLGAGATGRKHRVYRASALSVIPTWAREEDVHGVLPPSRILECQRQAITRLHARQDGAGFSRAAVPRHAGKMPTVHAFPITRDLMMSS
jgi:hypothetical protein